MGMRPSRLVVLPLEDPDGTSIHPSARFQTVQRQIKRFDIRQAQATNPLDIEPIVKCAERFAGGELAIFNQICRKVLNDRLLDNGGAAVLQNEREFALESGSAR